MRPLSIVALATTLASSTHAFTYFSIPLGPPASPPAPAGCPVLTAKPLGQFLLGPLFPNPYSSFGVPLSAPNCNAPPPPSNPCPAGEACKNQQNPCVAGQECLVKPDPPRYPVAQASGDQQCNAGWGGPKLRACIDVSGQPVNCCA